MGTIPGFCSCPHSRRTRHCPVWVGRWLFPTPNGLFSAIVSAFSICLLTGRPQTHHPQCSTPSSTSVPSPRFRRGPYAPGSFSCFCFRSLRFSTTLRGLLPRGRSERLLRSVSHRSSMPYSSTTSGTRRTLRTARTSRLPRPDRPDDLARSSRSSCPLMWPFGGLRPAPHDESQRGAGNGGPVWPRASAYPPRWVADGGQLPRCPKQKKPASTAGRGRALSSRL